MRALKKVQTTLHTIKGAVEKKVIYRRYIAIRFARIFKSITKKFENCTGRTTLAKHTSGAWGRPDSNRDHPGKEKNLHICEDFFMAHYVYILQSQKDKKYYIGETSM
jgi:hypothetical protein